MLEIIALILVIVVYKNDLKTIPKEKLAVSIGERILTQIVFLPFWVLDIALIVAIVNPALIIK